MIKPLTSLRFIFALMVFSHHLVFIQSDNLFIKNIYDLIFLEGHLGVSFFFILSGFVLALNYKEKLISNKISYKDFWIARIARIYPLHLLSLLISLPLCYKIFFTDPGVSIGKLLTNMSLLQSFIPIRDFYFSFNIPSWSISDEMFFYLMFPVIITLFYRFKNAEKASLFLLLLIPVGIFFLPDNIEHRLFYVNPFYRITDFILGILLFNIYEKRKLPSLFESPKYATFFELSSIGLFILFFVFHYEIPVGYRYSCYYWIPMALLVFVFSFQSGFVSKILSNRVLVYLGEISFGFYMLHFLAIKYVVEINSRFSLINNDFLLIAIILIASLVGSHLSYKFIEQPSNRFLKMKYKVIVYQNRENK